MNEKVRGANRPTSMLQKLLPIAAVLLLAAVLLAPVAADETWIELNQTYLDTNGNSLTSGNYLLTKDTTLSKNITIPANAVVILDLNGSILMHSGNDCVIKVETGGSITITDTRPSNTHSGTQYVGTDNLWNITTGAVPQGAIELTGDKALTGGIITGGKGFLRNQDAGTGGGCIFVSEGATVIMTGGTIAGNTAKNGGAVWMNPSTTTDTVGTFSLNNCAVRYNAVSGSGSAFFVGEYRTLNIGEGTTIANCTSPQTGAVYIRGGTVIMNGGTIAYNNNTGTSGYGGGGVTVYQSHSSILSNLPGSFTMNGGTISGNTATESGGGVYVGVLCEFTMENGATISGNIAKKVSNTGGDGGGVYLAGGNFTMNGGTITRNTAMYDGGGVQLFPGTMTMSGNAEVSYNEASHTGGGVYNYQGSFTMSGNANISHNNATHAGGLIINGQNTAATCAISGGEISNNTAVNEGAGIIIAKGSDVTFSGGVVKKNTLKNNVQQAISVQEFKKISISGTFTLEDGQLLYMCKLASSDTTGILIQDPFYGKVPIYFKNSDAAELDGRTIFTIADTVTTQKAGDLLNYVSLATDDGKWVLAANGDKEIVVALNKPKVESAKIEWINSTIANVTISLDPKANDATNVYVYFNKTGSETVEKQSVENTGTCVKGSSIAGLQVTGLDPEETYSVVAVLKNTNVVDKEFKYVILENQQPPLPDKVEIIGSTDDKLTLSYGGNVTLGVQVTNKSNILKDEYVTWEITEGTENVSILDNYQTNTPSLTVKVNGTKTGTATLKATTVHGQIEATIAINVSDADITSLVFDPAMPIVRGIGEEVTLTALAMDEANEKRFGEVISWTINPATLTQTGGEKTGEAATFTATDAGEYTVTATLTSSNPAITCSTTITFIDKPTVDALTFTEKTYVQKQEADPITVTAQNPAGTQEGLSFKWNKSTDKTFINEGSTVSSTATLKPSTDELGTFYYRAEVSYTETVGGTTVTTTNYSSIVTITVVEPTADSISVSVISPHTLYMGSTTTITATATNTTVPSYHFDVIWSISSGTAVSITPNGNTVTVIPVAEGQAVITASAGGKEQAVTITVKPASDAPTDTSGSTPSGSSGSSTWLPSEPTDTPTETPTGAPTTFPDTQPTDVETPGFGVLAVLAGLGAVAVLRRK